jgi:hypothetical protein
MSVSMAWRSAGEGRAIFASILIDLGETIGKSNRRTTADPQISAVLQRCGMRLSTSSSRCVADGSNPVMLLRALSGRCAGRRVRTAARVND